MKQAKLQWLQDPSKINEDNLNNVRREASKEYLKDKIDELATNSKNKNIRDLCRRINEFKRGYQPRSNIVIDENGDPLAELLFSVIEFTYGHGCYTDRSTYS
jgi:hypothetical protein